MPVPDISGLPPFADFNDVTIKINDLVQRLRQLLLTLDTLNIRSLHAKVIEAETITGDKIKANTITAVKMDVDELSAISANLGHIIAGLIESVEIYGSYIATRKNAFPRAEMSSQNDLFGAYRDASNSVRIEADYYGVPSLNIVQNGNIVGRINAVTGTLEINAIGLLDIYASGNMGLSPSGNLRVPPFTRVVSSNGYNLGAELDDKAVAGISTNPSGGHNHGIPDGTVLRTADGGTVTFFAAPQHTHQQTN